MQVQVPLLRHALVGGRHIYLFVCTRARSVRARRTSGIGGRPRGIALAHVFGRNFRMPAPVRGRIFFLFCKPVHGVPADATLLLKILSAHFLSQGASDIFFVFVLS